jgi:hypothetical protein
MFGSILQTPQYRCNSSSSPGSRLSRSLVYRKFIRQCSQEQCPHEGGRETGLGKEKHDTGLRNSPRLTGAGMVLHRILSWNTGPRPLHLHTDQVGIRSRLPPGKGCNLSRWLSLMKGNCKGGPQLCSTSSQHPGHWRKAYPSLKEELEGMPQHLWLHPILLFSYLSSVSAWSKK